MHHLRPETTHPRAFEPCNLSEIWVVCQVPLPESDIAQRHADVEASADCSSSRRPLPALPAESFGLPTCSLQAMLKDVQSSDCLRQGLPTLLIPLPSIGTAAANSAELLALCDLQSASCFPCALPGALYCSGFTAFVGPCFTQVCLMHY